MCIHSSSDYITMWEMCERRIAGAKETPKSCSSHDINCEAKNEAKWPKYDQTQNSILKSYFRVFLDSFKRNERQGGGKRTFNVTFAAPYKESVRRTILGMKSEFKSRLVWHLNDIRPIRFWCFMFACQNKNKNCKWICVFNFFAVLFSHIMWRQTRQRRILGLALYHSVGQWENLRVN